jgi:hypothetical protein
MAPAVVAIALALTGCDSTSAQHVAPVRPVLVTDAHYEAQVLKRSFVGTVRPRIESDLGFRVAGKVSKRLVEVGALVETGQPLAALDEIDLKLQADQADAEFGAATGVLAQAGAAEARTKELHQKGWSTEAQLDQAKAAADEARARLRRAERSVELTKNSLSYATLVADAPGVVTATLIEPGRAWLAAPDFTFAVGPSPARSLKELRGQRTVLLVLFSLPDSAPRMRKLAEVNGELQFLGTEIIAVPMSADPGILARLGGDPPVLYPVVTDGAADIVRAYALFGRTLAPAGLRPEPPAPAHMELLIDRQGYIRARWIPDEGRSSWSDLKTLRDEIRILAGEAAGPPPDEHVH